jgi:hypothetical protein
VSYIIDQESKERESVAIHRLLTTMPLRESLFGDVFSWFVMELRFSTLGLEEEGEIDIIGGRSVPADDDAYRRACEAEVSQWRPDAAPEFVRDMAERRFIADGGLAWPPPTDLLIGVEVKCAYERGGEIKSAKTSPEKIRDLHKQLRRDMALGLDIVYLVDIVANQPATGDGSDAWWHATNKAFATLDVARQILTGRVPEGSPVGHWIWSVGAVIGGDESVRGAGGPVCLQRPAQNPKTPARARVETLLTQRLAAIPRPRTCPVLLKDCRRCKTIHPFREGSEPNQDCLA